MSELAGNTPANSACARCGRGFHCGIDDDRPCWCATDFPLLLAGEAGQGCLCPDCLRLRVEDSRAEPT